VGGFASESARKSLIGFSPSHQSWHGRRAEHAILKLFSACSKIILTEQNATLHKGGQPRASFMFNAGSICPLPFPHRREQQGLQ
jgi:hypothetical protein